MIGWFLAIILWFIGMSLIWRINNAIIYYEHGPNPVPLMVHAISWLCIIFWPIVQLFSIQDAFVNGER